MFNCNNLFNILFADDTTALTKGKNIQDLSNFINSELQKLGTWLRSNKLAVNTGKTKIMIFYPKPVVPLETGTGCSTYEPIDPDYYTPDEIRKQ